MRKHKLWKFKRKEVLAYNQDLEKSMGLRYYKRELNFVPILKEKNESEKYSHCEESCFLLVFSSRPAYHLFSWSTTMGLV